MDFSTVSSRPPPGANITQPYRIGIGAPKQIPHMLPESKLYIPQTRNIAAETLWDQKCKCVPLRQHFGVAWVDRVPQHANAKHDRFVIVPLRVFSTHRKATRYKKMLHQMPKYNDRPVMLFEMGNWHALPIPVWLTEESDQVDYMRRVIVRLIDNDTKSTNVKHEVMKRRRKQDPEKLRSADEILTHTKEARDDTSVDRYLTADEETMLLESKGTRYEAPELDAEEKEQAWETPDDILSSKTRYGLMWVLPDVQSPGQKFTHVCFAWLGAYKTPTELDAAQRRIKSVHPEWSVISFALGTPLDLPVPSWIMQTNSNYVYDQSTMSALMMESPSYRSPDCVVQSTVDMDTTPKNIQMELVDAIVPQTQPSTKMIEETAEIPEGQQLLHKADHFSDNKMFSITVTQYADK